MSRIIAYTAVLGDIGDELQRPPELAADSVRAAQFKAFVDQREKVWQTEINGWTTRQQAAGVSPRRTARRLKVLAHKTFPDAEYSLWVDGCLTPITPVWELIDRFLSHHDICVFEHCERACVYKELEACLRLRKDNPVTMRKQVDGYRREGYPHDNGLAETTAVLRRHNKSTERFNEEWWEEINKGSYRDQLSFNHVCWRFGVEYATFEGNRPSSPHFEHRPHR